MSIQKGERLSRRQRAIPFLVPETASTTVDAFLTSAGEPLVVSEFAAAEVASALSRLVRTHKPTPSNAAERLADFDTWRSSATEDVDLQASDVRLTSIYVRRFDLMLRAPTPCTSRSASEQTCGWSPWTSG